MHTNWPWKYHSREWIKTLLVQEMTFSPVFFPRYNPRLIFFSRISTYDQTLSLPLLLSVHPKFSVKFFFIFLL